MKKLKLPSGHIVMLDDKDFERVKAFKWHVDVQKTVTYARRRKMINGVCTTILMHRFILNIRDGNIHVDHKDGNGLNNLRSNIRACTHRQNCMNKKIYNIGTSPYKGVSFCSRTKKWLAGIKVNGLSRYLGRHDNEIDAAKAYNKGAKKYFGKFANLNIIS